MLHSWLDTFHAQQDGLQLQHLGNCLLTAWAVEDLPGAALGVLPLANGELAVDQHVAHAHAVLMRLRERGPLGYFFGVKHH